MTASTHVPTALAPNSRRPTRVLVVDDTEGNRYSVARLLRAAGMQVDEAETGNQALRMAAAHLPDLVLVDVNLPDMSGFDVVRALRHDPATASLPVMHVSASLVTTTDQAKGLEGGADAYITHPVEPIVFLATVRALLRTGEAEAKTRRAAREWVSTFDTIGDAILIIDDDGTIRRCNRAAAQLVHREPREAVGQSLLATLGPAGAALLEVVASAPASGVELPIGDRWFAITANRLESITYDQSAPVVCVLADITSRKLSERERESLLERADEARRSAEDANKSKSDFLAVASHELRTPLNAIAGFVQLLALGIRGPVNEAQLADLDKIRRSQVTLAGLINDLLSFARLERGAVTYDIESLPVNETVTRCAELVETLARERHIEFSVEACGADLTVLADADKVQQVLLNLLSNAFKFTPPGGSVVLSCAARGNDALISVADTGRGVPAEKLDAIFDPFVQVDQRRARTQEGIGLGLSISRELSRAMHGDLTVESVLGAGSRFTLRLPRVVTSA
ncbi:MAG TPA: ATP-binding protein [Gemmatimonadaceae bacterium]|nr:ATP-binding protein [Gemmatimonadaceae bacterium]